MADVIYGYAPEVVEAVRETAPPAVHRLLDNGIVLAVSVGEADSAFEAWLVERWLSEIRSAEFRASVQGQRLIAEWERGES